MCAFMALIHLYITCEPQNIIVVTDHLTILLKGSPYSISSWSLPVPLSSCSTKTSVQMWYRPDHAHISTNQQHINLSFFMSLIFQKLQITHECMQATFMLHWSSHDSHGTFNSELLVSTCSWKAKGIWGSDHESGSVQHSHGWNWWVEAL